MSALVGYESSSEEEDNAKAQAAAPAVRSEAASNDKGTNSTGESDSDWIREPW